MSLSPLHCPSCQATMTEEMGLLSQRPLPSSPRPPRQTARLDPSSRGSPAHQRTQVEASNKPTVSVMEDVVDDGFYSCLWRLDQNDEFMKDNQVLPIIIIITLNRNPV